MPTSSRRPRTRPAVPSHAPRPLLRCERGRKCCGRETADAKSLHFSSHLLVYIPEELWYTIAEFCEKEARSIKQYDDFSELFSELPESDLGAEPPKPREKNKKKKGKHRGKRVLAIILSIVLFFEALYCFFVFTDIPSIRYLREAYIETALSTLSHRWLADWFLPSYMVDQVQAKMDFAQLSQKDFVSDSSDRNQPLTTTPPNDPDDPTDETTEQDAEAAFYDLFWELSRTSFEEYLDEHPETLQNGWDNIYINEAGLDDEGTSIYTTMGEQVLAIDVPNQILLIRVQGTGYLGVLAIAKDPSQLRCHASTGLPTASYGQTLEDLVLDGDGVLGMCASGFYDPGGNGTGGIVAGYAMCEGKGYGTHYTETGYKRIELAENDRFYIVESNSAVGDDVTDAVEFSPALIVDGELTVGGFAAWNAINPRACVGQTERGEIMMLIIEGRQITRSIGTDVETCAEILMRHNAYTAMNLDGGTSAVMWYDGEYVTKCSNQNIESRLMPNAWVYGYTD